jgi:hypothetical protein
VSSVILDKDGKAYKNVYILNDSLKVLLKKVVKDQNRYILDEFDNTSELKVKKILKNRIGNIGFYRKLSQKGKQKFEVISNKLMTVYFYEYVKFKFKAFYHGLGLAYIKANLHNPNNVEGTMILAYNAIKDRIIYLNPHLYSETIKLLKKYNRLPIFKLLSVWFIILYSLVFVGAIFMKLKRIFILVCFLGIFFIIQILIVPFSGFRFFFQYYLTVYLVMFYLIFYFIGNKTSNID